MLTLVLDSRDLQQIIRDAGIDTVVDKMIQRLQNAFVAFDPIQTQTPERTGFHYENPTGLIEWMPLHQQGDKVVMKLVGYHPESPRTHGSPTIVSTISTYDTKTGHLRSIIEGTFATAIRTGAASAIASRYMAAPDSRTLGLVGCGAQAVTQLHAIGRLFDLQEVLLFDVDPQAIQSFSQRIAAFDCSATVRQADLGEIARESDIICTGTSVDVGEGPVIQLPCTKPHLHINAIGSDFPGKTELPKTFLQNSFVCPDFLPQAIVEGECQQLASAEIGPTIVDVVKSPEKFAGVQQQLSVFDSTGWALEDLVSSELLLEMATNLGVGQQLPIEYISKDPRNPYDFVLADISSLR